MRKLTLFRSLECAIYPQYQWARAVRRHLNQMPQLTDRTLVDAPCGDGTFGYWISRWYCDRRLEFCDVDAAALTQLRERIPTAARVELCDIRELKIEGTKNLWLLVNSLYLLPQIDRVLSRLRPHMSEIVGIFPHLDHANYRCFIRTNPDFGNPFAMSQEKTVTFFSAHGYDLRSSEDLTPVPYHCWRLPYLNWMLRRCFVLMDPVLPLKRGAYWLGIFERC